MMGIPANQSDTRDTLFATFNYGYAGFRRVHSGGTPRGRQDTVSGHLSILAAAWYISETGGLGE